MVNLIICYFFVQGKRANTMYDLRLDKTKTKIKFTLRNKT